MEECKHSHVINVRLSATNEKAQQCVECGWIVEDIPKKTKKGKK